MFWLNDRILFNQVRLIQFIQTMKRENSSFDNRINVLNEMMIKSFPEESRQLKVIKPKSNGH